MKRIILGVLIILQAVCSNAQTACDSMTIDVKYAAFSDSLIEITVINNGSGFYSYPGFVIFNTNGDTVAKEEVVLFGIGSISSHVLKIYPGMVTSPTFTGVLQLWSGFYTTMECSYNRSFKLCPDTCVTVYPYMSNMGGALSLGTVNWTIEDTTSTLVASGSFTLDNTNQVDQDTVCLIPGYYTMHISGISTPMAGQPYYGISNNIISSPGFQKQYLNAASQMPFPFYKKCAVATSIPRVEPNADVKIFSHAGMINMRQVDGKHIGEVSIYGLTGQVAWSGTIRANKYVLDLSHLSPGIYIARINKNGKEERKKLILGK